MKALIALMCMVPFLAGCGGSGGSSGSTSSGGGAPAPIYEMWTGAIPCTYYSLNIYGDRALKITGKPWMVIKKDGITQVILDCEFGLSEVTQTQLPNSHDQPGSPEPTVAVTSIDYYRNLNLDTTKPATLCVTWGSKSAITNGVQNFSFRMGSSPGGVGYNESWAFSYLSTTLWGDVTNIDRLYFLGSDSDSKAFSLTRQ